MVLVVGQVLEFEAIPSKQNLYKSVIDIGAAEPITIVTNAKNLRPDSLTVVATVGSLLEIDGEEVEIKRVNVGGVYSEGMICDSIMCGWVGGGKGVAVQVPLTYRPGQPAPISKPRMDSAAVGISECAPELTEKERKAKEKEDRKLAAAARKAARKDKKGGVKDEVDTIDPEADDGVAVVSESMESAAIV